MQNKPNNNQPTNRVPTKFTNICTTIPTLIIINSTSNITNTLTLTDTIVQRHYHTVIMSCLWTIIYNNITVTSISMIILTLRCISQRTEAREMYNKLINKVPATKNNHKKKTNISITTSRCIGRKHEARGGNGETPATDRGDGMMGGGTPVDMR